ncbi:hypothetical protein K8I31_18210, partial [bacterium]|nr:hypothetical protein [bacterium]
MTAMIIWVYVSIVVASSLGANYMIEMWVKLAGPTIVHSDTSGYQLYPDWLVECHYAYFWFSAVLHYLLDHFSSKFEKYNPLQEIQWMVDKVLIAHIVTVIPLRLFGVPWQLAYGGSLLVTVVAPVGFATWYYPRWLKKQETEVFDAKSIVKAAKKSDGVLRFLAMYPAVSQYVFDNKLRNQNAVCLIQMRRSRPERDGLMEDILLQIPVDLKTLQPIEKELKFSRYLFYQVDERTSAFHLPDPSLDDVNSFDDPPDEFSLDKID